MNVRLLDVARQELDEAAEHYAKESSSLRQAFLVEVVSAIARIQRHPEAWHPLGAGIRRCRMRRFPYGLIYAIEKDGILVLAIAHTRRAPRYWKSRVS